MKSNIHPTYHVTEVICGCGATFVTRSTRPTIKIEICSACHPFYTGRQKFVDTAGRVERFTRKYGWGAEEQQQDAPAEAEAPAAKAPKKAATAKGEKTLKGLAKETKKALADGAKKQLAAMAESKAAAAEAAEAGDAAE